MIVHLTQDLMMTSHTSAAARKRDQKFKFVPTTARVMALANEHDVELVIVDLQTAEFEVAAFQAEMEKLDASRRPLAVAYAQHVNVDLLEQANASIFSQVFTRGQFNSNVERIVADSLSGTDS